MTQFSVEGQQFRLEECCACGTRFLMPLAIYRTCQEQGIKKSFYCPNGHSQYYTTTNAERLKEANETIAENERRIDRLIEYQGKIERQLERLRKKRKP